MNDTLLRQVAGHIRLHPEQHDQAEWCGTAMCVAGWACALSGYEVVEDRSTPWTQSLMREPGTDRLLAAPQIQSHAQRLLGLTMEQADSIFYSSTFNAETAASFAEALELIADGVDPDQVLL